MERVMAHLERVVKVKSSNSRWKESTSLPHTMRNFWSIHVFRKRERILLTWRDLETNYFVSCISTERERESQAYFESTGEQAPPPRACQTICPSKYWIRRLPFPPSVSRGINFRLSAINRPVYLGKLANQWKAGNIRDSIYNWARCRWRFSN